MNINNNKIFSIYLNSYLNKAIEESNLLKYYSKSRLINWCIELGLPLIIKEKNINNSDINRFIKMSKLQEKRNFILMEKKENTSKIFLFSRFIIRLKYLLNKNMNKEDILENLNYYYQESKYYENNIYISEKIKTWIIELKKLKSMENIKSYLDIEIKQIYRNNESDIKNLKQNK